MAGRGAMPESDRFMLHVRKESGGYWIWTGHRMPNGYGVFRPSIGSRLAHRASYRLFVGHPPASLDVMHSCDTPACVNPDHLSLGSRADNMRDAKRKGRMSAGETHGMAKLSAADVVAIRALSQPQKVIASRFGISQGHVSRLKRGGEWTFLFGGNVSG